MRRPASGWWALAATVVVSTLVVGAGVVSWTWTQDEPLPQPSEATDGPVSLPETVGPVPPSARSIRDAPAGRAIALVAAYQGDTPTFFTIGASRNQIRTVPEIGDRPVTPAPGEADEGQLPPFSMRLAPDGTRIAVGGGRNDDPGGVLVLDLRTGKRRLHAPAARSVLVLAWSPDSRRVAYSADTGLHVLDLRTGRYTTPAFDGDHYYGVAFSPDGERLAVDLERTVMIVPVDERDAVGGRPVTIPKQDGEYLPTDVAWSPNGSRLLLQRDGSPDESTPESGGEPPRHVRITFVDLTGTGPTRLAATIDARNVWVAVLAWRSPVELLVVEAGAGGTGIVARTPGDQGGEVVLVGHNDMAEIQLARGLSVALATRPGGNNDFGPATDPGTARSALRIATSLGWGLAVYLTLGFIGLLALPLAVRRRRTDDPLR